MLTYKEVQRSARQFGENSNHLRNMRKVLRTFNMVVGVFFFLTTPLCIYALLFLWALKDVPIAQKAKMLRLFVVLLSFNSCANPLIYGKIHKRLFLFVTCNFRNRRNITSNETELKETIQKSIHGRSVIHEDADKHVRHAVSKSTCANASFNNEIFVNEL